MPTGAGATDIEGAAKRIGSMMSQLEPVKEPTKQHHEDPDNRLEKAETLQSDTETNSRRLKAKLGDKEIEFELLTDGIDPELVPKGLMMEADYRQKTMDLGNQRKAIESKQAELDVKFNEAAELLQFELDNLEGTDMLELKEYDPDAYWKRVDAVKTKAQKLTNWRQSRQKEIETQQKTMLEKERENQSRLIPEWLDGDVKTKDVGKIKETALKSGMDEATVNLLLDGYSTPMLALARKAMLYDLIQSQDVESKRVKQAPKSAAPSTGKAERPDPAKDQLNRLRKTGKLADAQKAISSMLKFT